MDYSASSSWPVNLVSIRDDVAVEMVDHRGGYSVRAGPVGAQRGGEDI